MWDGANRRNGGRRHGDGASWVDRHRNSIMLSLNAVTAVLTVAILLFFVIDSARDQRALLNQARETTLGNRRVVREIARSAEAQLDRVIDRLHIDHRELGKVVGCIALASEPRTQDQIRTCLRDFRLVEPDEEADSSSGGGTTPSPRPSPSPKPTPKPSPSPTPSPTPTPEPTCVPMTDICLEEVTT